MPFICTEFQEVPHFGSGVSSLFPVAHTNPAANPRKRQYNRIFFLARAYVMMQHPKTLKEDAHDKTKQSG
jgi:hypothetical protein